jgi:hypothetical protein
MLISLLGYCLLGLLLALPLGRLLLWLAAHYGLYTPPWHYLRPYLPGPDRGGAAAPDAGTPPSA